MASETWRVVLADGSVREVEVSRAEAIGMLSPVCPWLGWRAVRTWDGPYLAATEAMGDSAREAVARLAVGNGLAVREILAPGEPTRAELLAQIATLTRVVDALRAAAVVAGHPAADGDPDAQLCAVRAAAWNAGAEAMRQEIVVSLTPREVDIGRLDRELGVVHALPVPPCPWGVCCGTTEVSR